MLYGIVLLVIVAFAAFLFYPHWRNLEPSVVTGDTLFHDSPRPANGFVLANIALLLLMVGTTAPVAFMSWGLPWMAVGVIGVFGVLCLYFIMLIHACFRTEYRINQQVLEMRSGFVSQHAISLSDITAVSRIHGIGRIMGWGPKKKECGFCNRASDGISISTAAGTCYVSPSDPEAFSAALNNAMTQVK